MKVNIEVNQKQAELIEKALKQYYRLETGQLHEVMYSNHLANENDFDPETASNQISELKELIFNLHGEGHNHPIRSEKVSDEARLAYDISEEIGSHLAYATGYTKGPSYIEEHTLVGDQPRIKVDIKKDF